MTLLNFPGPPLTAGDTYVAPNGVTYTWDPTIGTGVWTAAETAPTPTLTITNPGTITGTAEVGATLTYTTGTATGGVGAISYTWQWFITPSTPIGPVGTQGSITVPAGALNKNIYVTLTATDSATPTANTATANTANFPSSGTIQPAGITNAAAPTTIPGTANFTWANGSQNLTATGCIEFSVNGGSSFTQASTAVGNGTNIITRWKNTAGSGTCGDAPQGTTITGTLTDGTRTSTFNFQINRVPAAFSMTPNTESTTPLTITTANPTFTLSGCNTAPLIWGTLTGGGSLPEFSIDGGTTWVTLPSAPTSGVYVPVGTPAKVRFTTSSGAGTETLDVYAGASTTASEYRSSLFTVTVATSPFPSTTFGPIPQPNASPITVSIPSDPQLGQLEGTVSATWGAGTQSNVVATGSLQYQKNGGGYGQGSQTINNPDTVDLIWDPAAMSSAAHLAVLNGTLQNGVYTNSYSVTVEKSPTWSAPQSVTGAALSTAVNSGLLAVTGFNAPVTVSFANPSVASGATAMTATSVAVGGVSTPITLGTTTVTMNPGDTFQLFGTTGGTGSTKYGFQVTIGSASPQDWFVTTTAAVPNVSTPAISTPGNNSTGQGTPAGITITTDNNYTASGGAGAHASSNWELYANGYPLTSTNTISGVTQNAANAGTSSHTITGSPTASGLDYVNGNLVQLGQGTNPNYINYSSGGAWSQNNVNSSGYLQGILYAGSTFFVYGGGGGAGYFTFSSLSGGPTIRNSITNVTSMATDGTNIVAVGLGVTGTAYATIAGAASNSFVASSGSAGAWNSVAYGNGKFIAVTGGNPCASQVSTNGGSTFTAGGTFGNSGAGINATVAFLNGLFYACDRAGSVFSSADGSSWTSLGSSGATISTSASPSYGIKAVNGQLYIAASNGLFVSGNGSSWSTITTTDTYGVAGDGTNLYYTTSTDVYSGATPPTTTLAIAGAQTDGFLVGDTVISGSGAAAGPATILSLDNTQVTVTSSTGWVGTNTQTLKRDPASYTLASSATNDTTNLVSWPVAKPPLAANTTYYVRAQYTSAAIVTTSAWSPWSKFTTGSLILNPTTWTQSTGSGASSTRQVIRVGGTNYVAFGFAGVANSSNGGATWTQNVGNSVDYYTSQNTLYFNIAATNGTTVIASPLAPSNGTYSISTDGGLTWANAVLGTEPPLTFAYGNGKFMTIGHIGGSYRVGTSTTGALGSWTNVGPNPAATGSPNLWYVNNAWFCSDTNGGSGSRLWRSTNDGVSWTSVWTKAGSGSCVIYSVIYDSNSSQYLLSFCDTATGAGGGPGECYASSDGITWTFKSTIRATNNVGYFMATAGGSIVSLGNTTNAVYKSLDGGATWASQTAITNTAYGVIVSGPDRYIISAATPTNTAYSVG